MDGRALTLDIYGIEYELKGSSNLDFKQKFQEMMYILF